MLPAARGAQFPLVQVHTRLPESASSLPLDLEIEFAGQKAVYKQIPFPLTAQGNRVQITRAIPATLSDFKIDPPKLLTVPVNSELPIKVDMTGRLQSASASGSDPATPST